jgi:hypothetical protein
MTMSMLMLPRTTILADISHSCRIGVIADFNTRSCLGGLSASEKQLPWRWRRYRPAESRVILPSFDEWVDISLPGKIA